MYYFAYGSNLNRKQMLERCPDAQPKFTASLPNYIKLEQSLETPPAPEYLASIQEGYKDWGIV